LMYLAIDLRELGEEILVDRGFVSEYGIK
jgi:hypothetical protein